MCVCTHWNADITKYTVYRGHRTQKSRTSNPEMLLSKCDFTQQFTVPEWKTLPYDMSFKILKTVKVPLHRSGRSPCQSEL